MISMIQIITTLVLITSCANNNIEIDKNKAGNNISPEEKEHATVNRNSPDQGENIIGEWQLTMIITDANANNKIDEDERKDAIREAEDYLKLNSDGTCLFYAHKTKGRYEIKTQSNGKKILYLFDKDNNKENRGQIFSVSATELIMLSHSVGSTFKIYKRL